MIKKRGSGVVLAEGEVTGHAHVAYGAEASIDERGVLTLTVGDSPTKVVHEEHNPVVIETPGDYSIGIVQEYDPIEREARPVYD